jgi:uracil-DNA glycosylase family 4
MFVGEAPGRSEDIEGRPFVGQAGSFLETLLSEASLSREGAFICNIVRCRPPRNREPLWDEIRACAPYLDRQIDAIQPKFIVTLGSCSTAYIFTRASLPFNSITQAHGRLFEGRILGVQVVIYPTFHPAAALYSAKYKEHLVADFRRMKSELLRRGIVSGSSS